MLVFTIVIYNASVHCCYTTRKNKFLTKTVAVVMLSYLTFVTTKVEINCCHICFLIPMAVVMSIS